MDSGVQLKKKCNSSLVLSEWVLNIIGKIVAKIRQSLVQDNWNFEEEKKTVLTSRLTNHYKHVYNLA